MRRFPLIAVALSGILLLPLAACGEQPVSTDCYGFWYGVKRDHHRNMAWPEPYVSLDRQAVAAPFEAMVQAGWRARTTLGTHDFDPETQSLSKGGQRRLQSILAQVPEPYRTVYVANGRESSVTARRMESVQQALAKELGGQPMPPVIATTREPRAWAAEEVNTIERRLQSSVPSPRLPEFKPAGSLTQGQ